MPIDLAKVLALPIEERIRIAQSIWDSVVEVPEAVELTDEQRNELDRRIKAYRADPTAGSPWSEVRKRILASR
jgi:putative addiction module component (TIGR02574 family)